jgi:hypothetical protein
VLLKDGAIPISLFGDWRVVGVLVLRLSHLRVGNLLVGQGLQRIDPGVALEKKREEEEGMEERKEEKKEEGMLR